MTALQNDAAADTADKDMKFDDINLNDDKSAPKLDLDFGLDAPADKKSGVGGFSFGSGWGGGWGSTSSWGFGGLGDKKDDSKVVDDSGWDFTSTSSKKVGKKNTSGFDFNFDSLGGEDDPGLDLGAPAKQDKAAEEDPW